MTVFFAGWLALGLSIAGGPEEASDSPGPDVVQRAASIIEERVGGQIDRSFLYQSAANELALELDALLGQRGNAVLTLEQLKDAQLWRRGFRVGIGVEFQLIPSQGLLLTHVMTGSSGESEGLQSGDVVVGIDGQVLTGMNASEMMNCIDANGGEPRVLDFRRGSDVARAEVPLDSYKVLNIRKKTYKGRSVIELNFFGEGASTELATAIRTLQPKEGVILDLRDNQGGLLAEAVASASIFLEAGSVVLQKVDWDGTVTTVRTNGEQIWHSQVVLLVNQGTVGPAEVFVAALQTHQVGKSVGTETAGNTGMPSYHELGSGLVLQLTDQTMRGPLGEDWAGRGLVPDVRVEPVGFALQPRPDLGPPDLQLDAAIQLIFNE